MTAEELERHSGVTLYPVSIPGFAGPLDLLLSLIENAKLDISQVSLAVVTEQYLGRLRSVPDLVPEHLAEFLVVAATLLLIKSRRLFSDFTLTGEEEERVVRLEEQLREYRKFRAAAKNLLRYWDRNLPLFARSAYLGLPVFFSPPPGLQAEGLRTALGSVVAHLPRLDFVPGEVLRRVVSLEERIRAIQERLASRARLSFQEVKREAKDRLEVIVSFLALLQLVKEQLVSTEQAQAFQDIVVWPRASEPNRSDQH